MGPPRIGQPPSAAPLRPVQFTPAPAPAVPAAPADPTGRHVDAFEPGVARPASRLERSAAFGRLDPAMQTRVRALERTLAPADVPNLTRVVSARGFSALPAERQGQMLDVFARHPSDRRVAAGLSRLPASRAFIASDAASQAQAVSGTATPERLRGDALEVLNTTTPERLTVHGVPIDVYGASAGELETIRATLDRLPASHLRTIPRVVVGDTIGHGNNTRGGAWVPQRSIDAYEAGTGGGRNAAAYRAEGWTNPPRLELTHESLGRTGVVTSHLSPTILHETGHAVDERYGLSGGLSPASMGNVDYNGAGHTAEGDLGPVHERFADGYMRYYLGSLDSDATAFETVSRAIERVPE